MKPELFIKAQRALKRVGEAGEGVLNKAIGEPGDSKRNRNILLLTGAGIIAAIALLYAMTHIGADEEAPPVDTRQAVTVITVAEQTFEPRISLSGEARPQRDIQVYAQATGVRILQLLVDEGDTVREGQPMARLDAALSDAQTRAAQASVAEAEAAAVRARGEYQRAESIRESGALSAEAIEARRSAAVAADARLAAARAQLQEVNARVAGGYVRAPASGLVIDRTAQLGETAGQEPLFRIAAGNALEVSAQVAEAEALALREGQSATFTLVDGSTVTATLRRAPASIDSRTRTGEALFALPSNTRVRAGMFLRGEAVLDPRQSLAAPQSSILYEAGEPYVFIIDGEGRARRVAVTLGARNGDMVEVTNGLQAGMQLIGSGAAFLQEGDEVRAINPNTPAAATPADLRGREG